MIFMMKRPAPKPRRTLRQTISIALCALVAAAGLGYPAASATSNEAPEPQAPALTVESPDAAPTEPDADAPIDTGVDEPGEPDAPDSTETPDPDVSPSPGVSPNPDEIPEGHCAVTFIFQENNTMLITLPKGESLTDENMPDISLQESTPLGYIFVAWLDRDGNEVDPMAAPIEENTTFTAQWRHWTVEDLLETERHDAYASGYTSGTFRPTGKVTRVEASMLFYNLLKDKAVDIRTFTDVPADHWASAAVSKMAELGVAVGFEDGSFKPGRNITRAELAKMAASLDVLEDAEYTFPDVAEDSWARPYIASVAAKGWMIGDNEGNFNPSQTVTRAEAITTLNRMLGRVPSDALKTKNKVTNFYDVFPDNWAYCHIVEATTSHAYNMTELGQEEWTVYTPDERSPQSGWVKDDGKSYYVGSSGKFVRGEQTINGKTYLFDSTGAAATGFYKKSGWTRYYKNGLIVEDISNLGVVKGPYYIKVYKPANYVIIFAKDSGGKYTIPVRSMLCSCGDPTPTGTYYTPARYRWLEMVGGSWAQWCTQIIDSYLFHSVPNDLRNNYTMWAGEYNNLGTTRSLGCIRLTCEDAKWVYDNCAIGTQVYVSPSETSGPLPKPVGIKLPGWHTWDPTDPTAKWMCKEHGCH